eukprot:517325-Pleurochrysis_carterae.AAC.2
MHAAAVAREVRWARWGRVGQLFPKSLPLFQRSSFRLVPPDRLPQYVGCTGPMDRLSGTGALISWFDINESADDLSRCIR